MSRLEGFPRVVQIQYPLESSPNFHSMIDMLLMMKYEWGTDGSLSSITGHPTEEIDKAGKLGSMKKKLG